MTTVRPPAQIVLLLAAAISGCGAAATTGSEDLRDRLDALDTRNAALEERVVALEAELADRVVGDDPVGSLRRSLDEVGDDLEGIAGRLDAQLEDRDRAIEDMSADLRASLADVRDLLEGMRGHLEDLEIRYEVLRQRLDQLQ